MRALMVGCLCTGAVLSGVGTALGGSQEQTLDNGLPFSVDSHRELYGFSLRSVLTAHILLDQNPRTPLGNKEATEIAQKVLRQIPMAQSVAAVNVELNILRPEGTEIAYTYKHTASPEQWRVRIQETLETPP